jgi:hypothetical protein
MLTVFGDESADESATRVFAVAGIIGTDEMWGRLETKWLNRTKGTPFHANACDCDRGQYAGIPHAENKSLYRDLTIMLAESGLGGWAFVIDVASQQRVFPGAPNISYYKGFVEVLAAMRNCALNNRETVSFTFDMRRETHHNAGLLYGMFREMGDSTEVLFSQVSFACSSERTGLQAADLFARESMKAYDNRFGPTKREPRKSWLALRDTNRFHVEAIGDSWFEDLREQMARLEKDTGQSRDDYLRWLDTHKMQHSTTSLFRYVKWRARSGGGDKS